MGLKKKIIAIIMLLSCAVVSFAPIGNVSADDAFCKDDMPENVKEAMGCSDMGKNAFPDAVKYILEVVIGAGGLVAGVYVVIGGVKYMTSDGDAGKIKSAKTTILYALIGMIVAALAFTIANWAINMVNDSHSSSSVASAASTSLVTESLI